MSLKDSLVLRKIKQDISYFNGRYKDSLILFVSPNIKFLDKTLDLLYNYVTFLYKAQMTTTTESGGRQNMFHQKPVLHR